MTAAPQPLPPSEPASVGRGDYRDAMARLAAGVGVVTTLDPLGRDCAMTVTSFTAVSLDPPLVLVCLKREGFLADALAVSDGWAVTMLAEDQVELARYAARHRHPGSRDDIGGGPYGEAWAAPRCCPAASRRSSAGPMPSTRPATTSWSSGAWWGSPWTLRAGR